MFDSSYCKYFCIDLWKAFKWKLPCGAFATRKSGTFLASGSTIIVENIRNSMERVKNSHKNNITAAIVRHRCYDYLLEIIYAFPSISRKSKQKAWIANTTNLENEKRPIKNDDLHYVARCFSCTILFKKENNTYLSVVWFVEISIFCTILVLF